MSSKKTETNRDGLKIRRAETTAPVVVNKPRKMKLLKPTRVATYDNKANPALLSFPTDKLGITSGLKKEFIKAASRVGSDKGTLKLIEDTLDILNDHLEARFKENVDKPVLKQRVDTKTVESTDTTSEEELGAEGTLEGQEEVSYEDMLAALKEADVKPASRKKEDVTKAFTELGNE